MTGRACSPTVTRDSCARALSRGVVSSALPGFSIGVPNIVIRGMLSPNSPVPRLGSPNSSMGPRSESRRAARSCLVSGEDSLGRPPFLPQHQQIVVGQGVDENFGGLGSTELPQHRNCGHAHLDIGVVQGAVEKLPDRFDGAAVSDLPERDHGGRLEGGSLIVLRQHPDQGRDRCLLANFSERLCRLPAGRVRVIRAGDDLDQLVELLRVTGLVRLVHTGYVGAG